MNKRILLPSLALLAAAGVIGVAPEASSNTVPAIAGRAWIPSEQSCFSSGWSNVRNTCNQVRKLLIPVTLSFTGNTKFYATGEFAAPNIIGSWPTCTAIVNSLTNGSVAQSAPKVLTHAGSQTLLGTLNVSSASYTAHIDCDLPATPLSFGINSVQWQL